MSDFLLIPQGSDEFHSSPDALSGLCQTYVNVHPFFGNTVVFIVMSLYCAGMAYIFAKYVDVGRHDLIFIGYVGFISCYGIYKIFFCEHFFSIKFDLEGKSVEVGFKKMFGTPVKFTYSNDQVSGIEWEPSEVRLLLPEGRQAQLSVKGKLNHTNLKAEKFAQLIASTLEVPLTKVTFKATGDGG